MRTHHPAAFGMADRRGEELGPRQLAERGMRVTEDAHDAGRGHGTMAELVDAAFQHVAVAVAAFTLETVGPHLRRAGGRTSREPVENEILTRGRIEDLQDAKPADAAHHRIDDTLRERAGDHGVERIAAGSEHAKPGFDRLRLGRDDHGPVGRAQAFGLRHRKFRGVSGGFGAGTLE